MKKIAHLLFIFSACAACAGNSEQANTRPDFLIPTEPELTELHQEALDGMRELIGKSSTTRSEEDMTLLDKVLLKQDYYKFMTFPRTTVDEDKFMANPTAENLMKCIIPATTDISYIAEGKNGETYHYYARKRDGRWWPGMMRGDMKTLFAWLEKEMEKADRYDFIFFEYAAFYYFILYFDGEPVFYNMRGEKFSAKHVTDLIEYRIRTARDAENGGPVIIM